MSPYILESGTKETNTVMVSKPFKMENDTREIGYMENDVVMEYVFMLMGLCTRAAGLQVNHKEREADGQT